MYCTQTYQEFCPPRGDTVTLTVSADVETGGYGCAVAADDVEYACSMQDHCPRRSGAGCLLHRQ